MAARDQFGRALESGRLQKNGPRRPVLIACLAGRASVSAAFPDVSQSLAIACNANIHEGLRDMTVPGRSTQSHANARAKGYGLVDRHASTRLHIDQQTGAGPAQPGLACRGRPRARIGLADHANARPVHRTILGMANHPGPAPLRLRAGFLPFGVRGPSPTARLAPDAATGVRAAFSKSISRAASPANRIDLHPGSEFPACSAAVH
jgi:hypothetical protein